MLDSEQKNEKEDECNEDEIIKIDVWCDKRK